MWTKEYLQQVVREQLADYLLVTVSNRQPYSHVLKEGKIVCQRQAGGLVTALMPVMEAVKGIWIAAGTSPYDRQSVDPHSKVMVPPENPSYALKRVFLSKEDMNAYY